MIITALVGCSQANPEAVPPAQESEEVLTKTPTEEPTPTPDVNDINYILGEVLVNYEAPFREDAAIMAENEGGQLGHVSLKTYNAEENVFEFTPEGDAAYIPLNKMLDEYGEGRKKGSAQGFLIKFQPPEQADRLYFVFYNGPNEFGVNFNDGGRPSVYLMVDGTMELFDGELALEPGKFYNLMMAIDSSGEFRGLFWEEGYAENKSTFSQDFSQRPNGEGYQNQTWKLNIGFPPGTLKIAEYSVLTFEGVK